MSTESSSNCPIIWSESRSGPGHGHGCGCGRGRHVAAVIELLSFIVCLSICIQMKIGIHGLYGFFLLFSYNCVCLFLVCSNELFPLVARVNCSRESMFNVVPFSHVVLFSMSCLNASRFSRFC